MDEKIFLLVFTMNKPVFIDSTCNLGQTLKKKNSWWGTGVIYNMTILDVWREKV